MNSTTIAVKLGAQLSSFLGKLSPLFHAPTVRFIGDMVYGIIAGKDVKLSRIVRALDGKASPRKAEDRLSRLLSTEGIEAGIHKFVASEAAKRVHCNTLIIVDPSDIQKQYARRMEYLSKVWDGSRGEVGGNLGYSGCMAVACESGGKKPIPLHLRFWSASAPGFESENKEVEKVFDAIIEQTGRRGIFVYDRGGDCIEFYRYFLRRGVNFIVRLKERAVRSWGRDVLCGSLAGQCVMRYRDTVVYNSGGRESRVSLEYGVLPVRLPGIPGKPLHMVVVRGFGRKPMMLLTSLARGTSRKDLWQVVEGYMTRWRVEDTIRHVKSSYNLEDVRLMKYDKLKNLAAIVLLAVYFSMACIGNSEKHQVIASCIVKCSMRLHGEPEFHFYAIADGIQIICSRHNVWNRCRVGKKDPEEDSLFAFFGVDSDPG